MTLKHEAQERMKAAPRNELTGDSIFHYLNCPAFQVGYMEKEIGQKFNH